MPPRIPKSSTASSALANFTLPLSVQSSLPKPYPQGEASFSTTASRPRFTKERRLFRIWINGEGAALRKNGRGETNYIQTKLDIIKNSSRPFPLNSQFKSEPVLDETSRELIWSKVMRNGETIKAVSAELGVDIRRVAAIVRLKEVEMDWVAKGKQLAKPYAKAMLSMLPRHTIRPDLQNEPFEPINEIHVHPYTMKQIFWPTSESRHFTRADAAKAFHHTMLSADERVPHPELIQMEKDVLQGRSLWDASERFKQAAMESERKAADRELAKVTLEEKYTTRVNTKRCEFRFKQINSENVGPKGRSRNAVGWRYGAPHYDRSKGEVKIPTSVP
ncbi:eukaryotic mitochondrial regulator protein-domain-containing protein [Hypoxylon trugodes]|uniref:eukaryotic mitochondrial regulator protein-domain-containing protein n=1 Tax=Hypoxylon trugodes TaxID=326681 RepID=UPI0021950B93|nr:eukaryotic mitochondrial regulator protein-domain-containing protein [Hypoxylon trugodes]KAI1392205.1 eukaryotic mitochondrial regulator protein-domain-containing protein [Hypoxylon trugodes]